MLSDIHFDPFDDPAKLEQLLISPIQAWPQVLRSPPSPSRAATQRALLARCRSEGISTTQALLDSALNEARVRSPRARFVIVAGDFFTHGFQCRFENAAPQPTAAGYREFAQKTFQYVTLQLREAFRGLPVIIALGNHDSGCGNYRQDARDPFIAAIARTVAEAAAPDAPGSVARQFARGGYYQLTLPAAGHARIVVINDIPMSRNFRACDGTAVPDAAQAQLQWLRQTLSEARTLQQPVWVVGHIPPGIEPWGSLKGQELCSRGRVLPLLADDQLSGLLGEYADVVRLGIFGHTHMDEFRVVASMPLNSSEGVPLKVLPSITPSSGNRPAFTVARIELSRAALDDYEVFVASSPSAETFEWSASYRFRRTYHMPSFSGHSLAFLAARFRADRGAVESASRAFREAYSPRSYVLGSSLLAADALWPQYACALDRLEARAFMQCACKDVR